MIHLSLLELPVRAALAWHRSVQLGNRMTLQLPCFSFTTLRRTRCQTSSKFLTHLRVVEVCIVPYQCCRLPPQKIEASRVSVPGSVGKRSGASSVEPQPTLMQETTEGRAQSVCAICPLKDGTHQFIPVPLPGQLFFSVFSHFRAVAASASFARYNLFVVSMIRGCQRPGC